MAGTSTPIFPQTVRNAVVTIAPADTTTLKTVYTGATNGTRIESMIATSTDTGAQNIQVWATISAVNYLLGTVAIPANSGNTNALVTVDLLRAANFPGLAFDSNGNKYVYLASGTVLSVSTLATVTTAKQIQVFAQGGDY